MMDFSGLNIWEIFVAPLATYLIGYLWYSRALFGKRWQALNGLSDENIRSSNMALVLFLSYFFNVIIAFFLSVFIEIAMMIGSNAFYGGLFASLICIGLVVTSIGINYLFSRKPLQLFLIDSGFMILSFFIMGFIIGAWK